MQSRDNVLDLLIMEGAYQNLSMGLSTIFQKFSKDRFTII